MQEVLDNKIEGFVKALKSIGAGDLAEEAANNMVEGIKATMIEGKKSTVTITLSISQANDEMVTIEGTSTAKLPKPKPQSTFFVDGMTYLPSRERPEQRVMTFERGER